MGELAVGAIDLPPPLDQIEDRLLLPSQQPVDRASAGIAVRKRSGLPQPRSPPMRADV